MTQQVQNIVTEQKYLLTLLLPKIFNNGRRVPRRLFNITYKELLELFGGYSRGQIISGAWRHEGKTYRDQNITVNILVDNIDELLLKTLSNTLKERFKQLAIYMTVQDVKVYITD